MIVDMLDFSLSEYLIFHTCLCSHLRSDCPSCPQTEYQKNVVFIINEVNEITSFQPTCREYFFQKEKELISRFIDIDRKLSDRES